MAKKPKEQMLELLHEIRAQQDDHGVILKRLERDFQDRAEHPKYDERPDLRTEEAD